MERLRSKTGCWTCRLRRKKCDEQRPICAACAQLGLGSRCTFPEGATRPDRKKCLTTLGTFDIRLPAKDDQALPLFRHVTSRDIEVIGGIPQMVSSFYVPMASQELKGCGDSMRLILFDELVRDSVIMCFSPFAFPQTSAMVSSNGKVLKRVLIQLRSLLPRVSGLDHPTILCLSMAVNFVGLTESVGPPLLQNPLQHWLALADIVTNISFSGSRAFTIFPQSMQLLVLESLMFHLSTLAIFADCIDSVASAWHKSEVAAKVLLLNPSGESQVEKSMLIGAQYELYATMFRLTVLMHRCGQRAIEHVELLRLRQSLACTKGFLVTSLSSLEAHTSDRRVNLLRAYNMCCVASSMIVSFLENRQQNLDHVPQVLIDEALSVFLGWPVTAGEHSRLTWPLQVLLCAIESTDDLAAFRGKFEGFKVFMNTGCLRRTEGLLRKITEYRKSKVEAQRDTPSHAMHLLMQEHGVQT